MIEKMSFVLLYTYTSV